MRSEARTRHAFPTLAGPTREQLPPSDGGRYAHAVLPRTGRYPVAVVGRHVHTNKFGSMLRCSCTPYTYLCKQVVDSYDCQVGGLA